MSDKPKCGAKTRAGTPCSYMAGYKTDHPGVGRCYLHGGRARIKHGKYSKIRGHLGEKIGEHLANPDPLNLLPELASLTALLELYLEKNPDADAAPGALPLVDGIRKTVDTIHKMQTRELLTSHELEQAIQQLILIIVEEVKDADTITRISNRFASAFRIRTQIAAGAVKELEAD